MISHLNDEGSIIDVSFGLPLPHHFGSLFWTSFPALNTFALLTSSNFWNLLSFLGMVRFQEVATEYWLHLSLFFEIYHKTRQNIYVMLRELPIYAAAAAVWNHLLAYLTQQIWRRCSLRSILCPNTISSNLLPERAKW